MTGSQKQCDWANSIVEKSGSVELRKIEDAGFIIDKRNYFEGNFDEKVAKIREALTTEPTESEIKKESLITRIINSRINDVRKVYTGIPEAAYNFGKYKVSFDDFMAFVEKIGEKKTGASDSALQLMWVLFIVFACKLV